VKKVISKRVQEIRLRLNLSQKQLAEKALVPQSTISDIESGKRTPRWDTLYKIASSLNTTTSYLIGEIDEEEIKVNNFLK